MSRFNVAVHLVLSLCYVLGYIELKRHYFGRSPSAWMTVVVFVAYWLGVVHGVRKRRASGR